MVLKGNRAFADLRYGEEDSISPITQIFKESALWARSYH